MVMITFIMCATVFRVPRYEYENGVETSVETNPLRNPRDYELHFVEGRSRPVTARPFNPPNWILEDPSYNPGDSSHTLFRQLYDFSPLESDEGTAQ